MKIKTILKDWCDFCEGREKFDKSHFITLFHEDIKDEYLEMALQFFPNQDELIDRVINVREFYPERGKNMKAEPDYILDLAIKDVREKRKACKYLSEDELVNIIDNAKPKFVSDKLTFERALNNEWNGEFLSQVGFYFDECWNSEDDSYYALFEAFYGMTNSYEIQWYLGRPLMNTSVNPDYFYELWKAKGCYALSGSELIVSIE